MSQCNQHSPEFPTPSSFSFSFSSLNITSSLATGFLSDHSIHNIHRFRLASTHKSSKSLPSSRYCLINQLHIFSKDLLFSRLSPLLDYLLRRANHNQQTVVRSISFLLLLLDYPLPLCLQFFSLFLPPPQFLQESSAVSSVVFTSPHPFDIPSDCPLHPAPLASSSSSSHTMTPSAGYLPLSTFQLGTFQSIHQASLSHSQHPSPSPSASFLSSLTSTTDTTHHFPLPNHNSLICNTVHSEGISRHQSPSTKLFSPPHIRLSLPEGCHPPFSDTPLDYIGKHANLPSGIRYPPLSCFPYARLISLLNSNFSLSPPSDASFYHSFPRTTDIGSLSPLFNN